MRQQRLFLETAQTGLRFGGLGEVMVILTRLQIIRGNDNCFEVAGIVNTDN